MRYLINQSEFSKTFRLDKATYYEMFSEILNDKLTGVLHPSAVVDNLNFISTWKDAGGNIHARLQGKVSGFGYQKELGGEFVWLKNLSRFRGKVWSSLKMHSDLSLLMAARDTYRRSEYHEAKKYLDSIKQIENLPGSAMKLKKLTDIAIECEESGAKVRPR